MASIVLNGDTSGSVTLSPPAVAGTQTVTLPAATGTVMVSGNNPTFGVYRSANQTISTGVFTKIAFDVELFDTANCFDTSTYRFTPTVAGYYQINAMARIRGTASDNKILSIYKNGSDYSNQDNYIIAIEYFCMSVSQIIYMNGTTDYLEVYAYTNGSNTTVTGNAVKQTAFSGSLVRTA
jgi:hypothetical protein